MNSYSAKEIVQIGIEIEKNGEAFYRAAADGAESPEVRTLFADLAGWEMNHVSIFQSIGDEIQNETPLTTEMDENDLAVQYLKATADSHIFVKNKNMEKLAHNCKSEMEALEMALTFEKDSVLLYTAMTSTMKDRSGSEKKAIEKMTREEMKHVSIIQEQIQKMM
ncbi:MAG: ferritin-like domain-containing protein [Fibrobacterota bacterium]